METTTMARLFYENAWKSDKVLSIQPAEWVSEYAWVYSIATADGTFEASPRLIWMAAYAGRPDWTPEKVARLLDEFERVGLLVRAKDENGKIWGQWVGSEKFLPSEERCKTARYKVGRRDLFKGAARSSTEQQRARTEQHGQGLGVGVGVGVGEGEGKGFDLDSAAKSENEQPQEQSNPKGVCEVPSSTPTPTPKTKRLRKVIPRAEFESKKEEQEIAQSASATNALLEEFKAELAARPPIQWTPEEQKRMTAPKRATRTAFA
jgi:hypothetical protein